MLQTENTDGIYLSEYLSTFKIIQVKERADLFVHTLTDNIIFVFMQRYVIYFSTSNNLLDFWNVI